MIQSSQKCEQKLEKENPRMTCPQCNSFLIQNFLNESEIIMSCENKTVSFL